MRPKQTFRAESIEKRKQEITAFLWRLQEAVKLGFWLVNVDLVKQFNSKEKDFWTNRYMYMFMLQMRENSLQSIGNDGILIKQGVDLNRQRLLAASKYWTKNYFTDAQNFDEGEV